MRSDSVFSLETGETLMRSTNFLSSEYAGQRIANIKWKIVSTMTRVTGNFTEVPNIKHAFFAKFAGMS